MCTLHMISRTNNVNWPSIRQVISVGWISYLFRHSHCRRTSSIIDVKYTLQMRNVILFQTRYSRPDGHHAGKVGWTKAKQLDQEANTTTRWLKESIWIRSRGDNTLNKDDGGYKLNRIFDQLITKRQPDSTRDDVTRQAVKQLVK